VADYAGIDFLVEGALPAPRLTEADAQQLAHEHFGIDASATSLGSQQDANFLLTQTDGTIVGVLRVANPAFTAAELDAQDAAADHMAARDPSLRVGTVLSREAPLTAMVQTPDGPARARVLRYLDGGTLYDRDHLSTGAIAELGALAARANVALADFDHPGLHRRIQWDLQYADVVVSHLIAHIADDEQRTRIQAIVDAEWATVLTHAPHLPRQAMHNDVTDTNVVCTVRNGARILDGIIDFGDLTHSWSVGDLAVALSSVLRHPGVDPARTLPAISAFHAIRPLSENEVAALWPLVVVRGAVCLMSSEQQVTIDENNHYAAESIAEETAMFEGAASVPSPVMEALIRDMLGMSDASPHITPTGSLFADLSPDDIAVLDLGWDSNLMNAGAWLDASTADRGASTLIAAGARAVVTRWGQPQLTASRALTEWSPATVPTGIDVWLAFPLTLTAPWSGEVVPRHNGFALRGSDATLIIECDEATATAAGPVITGDPLVTTARARITVVVGVDAPAFVRPEYAPGWLAQVADPAALLGLAQHQPQHDDTFARRERTVASVQEHYYVEPPRIECGWRHHLIDTSGRTYLDMVNNVTVLGHAHPRVADAAARQLNRLNTNSRLHYSAIAELCERLTELLPESLDTVFLVNSGSEATDLALRLAMAATERVDVLAMREAYHGWTYLSDAVSTSTADNPTALETRPEWVCILDSPNSYRGTHRGADAHLYAADAVRTIDELAANGHPPAALIAETFYGNAGGVALPEGYLAAVYDAVRRHGGLAIADEVQVGYGRLGSWFWGFEQQGVVPDIVAVAKAMGNGHPLGAVITSREIADRFASQGYFFSSTGGSPVSCAVGLAVLDTLRDEHLQDNARLVGAHLKRRMLELSERHALIGAVHGEGLYMGVELVRDRDTLEPATEETYAICERLLELGIIVQPTSDRMCVLKIKPPLCIDIAAAEFFADMLDKVLTEGW